LDHVGPASRTFCVALVARRTGSLPRNVDGPAAGTANRAGCRPMYSAVLYQLKSKVKLLRLTSRHPHLLHLVPARRLVRLGHQFPLRPLGSDGDLALDNLAALPPPRASALVGLALLAVPFMWCHDTQRLHLPREAVIAL
jgi:hypothetical protein